MLAMTQAQERHHFFPTASYDAILEYAVLPLNLLGTLLGTLLGDLLGTLLGNFGVTSPSGGSHTRVVKVSSSKNSTRPLAFRAEPLFHVRHARSRPPPPSRAGGKIGSRWGFFWKGTTVWLVRRPWVLGMQGLLAHAVGVDDEAAGVAARILTVDEEIRDQLAEDQVAQAIAHLTPQEKGIGKVLDETSMSSRRHPSDSCGSADGRRSAPAAVCGAGNRSYTKARNARGIPRCRKA